MSIVSRTVRTLSACAAFALPLACASMPPTPELVEARTTYETARNGPAAKYAPDRVYDAKRALDAAEREHEHDSGSTEEVDLAYVAQRKAMTAMAIARQKVSAQRLDMARKQQETLLLSEREAQNERLARMLGQQARRISISGAVLFKLNGSELLPFAKRSLDGVADALMDEAPDTSITIEGHTDSTGTDAYNQGLSQRRAESVRAYLSSRGVPMTRMKAEGKGESSPVAGNDTPEGRADNRRVEIVVNQGAKPSKSMPPMPSKPMPEPRKAAPSKGTPSTGTTPPSKSPSGTSPTR